MDIPPCITPGQPLNRCARALYEREVSGHTDLTAAWSGWRLRGSCLVSPDGDRITAQRLRGLLFVESLKRSAGRGPGKVRHIPELTPTETPHADGEQREASP